MDIHKTIKLSPKTKDDSCNDVLIKSELSEIDIVDEKHLPEGHRHLKSSSIKGNTDHPKNELGISHMLRHNPANRFECKICKKTFAVKRYLKKHTLIHEKRGAHVCDICFRGFTYLSNLNEHLRKHSEVKPRKCKITGEKPFECDACKQKFASHSCVRRHIVNNMKSDRHYKCPSCVKGFSMTEALENHIQDACLDKTCEYDVLRTKLIIPTALFHQQRKECQTVARRQDQSGHPYFCGICSKFFLKSSYFYAHQNLHLIKKRNVCKISSDNQNNKMTSSDYEEINEVHKMGDQQITFKSSPLRTYKRKCIKEKMQIKQVVSIVKTEPESEMQDKEATNLFEEQRKVERLESESDAINSNSDAHQNLHRIQSSYICETCKKIFFTKARLYAHQRSRTGGNPYFECCDCMLKFCHNSTLEAHKRTFHPNRKEPSQQTTLKNASLTAHVSQKTSSSIKDGKVFEPTNFQRGVLKTYARRKNLGVKLQNKEIVVKTEPVSELQNKEVSNLLQEQRLFGKLNERKNSILSTVKEEPCNPLDLSESENTFFFLPIKEETSDPLNLSHEGEACDIKVELEE
ncbi:zinc finger protein 235-like isoform X2 [Belonocnema kinseyi]|uniref:zinc finger protein 235-like isoform X2 n=1 Tax=Belonocnema kinseyi TaxID=2817044 RepID=UPI00143D8DE5|nr:zinc finger protein 235-like isoform X2 [Belonocnema kinseyi]